MSNFAVRNRGLFLEWVDDYNKEYNRERGDEFQKTVYGFNLRMDGPKRREYCAAEGIPFDEVIYANIVEEEENRREEIPLPLKRDFDVFIGNRVGTKIEFSNYTVDAAPVAAQNDAANTETDAFYHRYK